MGNYASFIDPEDPNGPTVSIRRKIHTLTSVTTGDQLYIGQMFRTRIRQRTNEGIDTNGAPFVPYSTKGPYYFYPNAGAVGNVRGPLASTDPGMRASVWKARSTAARNRYSKTGKVGTRTPVGIKYASYAEAKAVHGRSTVDLYGMEQHIHMLDTMVVQAGGTQINYDEPDFGGEFSASENIAECFEVTLGFYGPEAERAKGNNEGTAKLPQREFFALSQEDLQLAEQTIGERIEARLKSRQK